MALIIPPGFAHAVVPLQHAALARTSVVTLGLDVSFYAGDWQQAAESFQASLALYFRDVVDSEVTIGPAELTVGTDGAEPIKAVASSSAQGTRPISSVPPNVAVLVRQPTNRGGRRGRGRMYIPWSVSEAAVDEGGRLGAAERQELQTQIDEWYADLVSTPIQLLPVVLHSPSRPGVANPTAPGVPNPITSFIIDGVVATQRRRLGRR